MRVTFSMTYQKMLLNLNKNQQDSSRLSNQIATGKKMASPKDDPLDWSRAMDIKQGLRELGAFQDNLDFATGWNETTEDALNQLYDLLTQARQAGISAVSAGSDGETDALVATLDQISEQALGVANTRYDNMYVFSGMSFSTEPFDATTLDYQGDNEAFQVRLGKNHRQTINIDGESVFYSDPADPSTNLLKSIQALKTAIQNGDTTEIQNQTAALESAQDHVNAMSSLTGARLSNLDAQQTRLDSLELNSKTELSDVEGVDILEAITQLQQKQTVLEAALSVTSMIDDLSLVRFLS